MTDGQDTLFPVPERESSGGMPRMRADLEAAGYVFDRHPSKCRACRAPVLWAVTPAGRKMPFEKGRDRPGELLPHHAYCSAWGKRRPGA